MIDCGLFQFAGPPRTATSWVEAAMSAAGLRFHGCVHLPHSDDPSKIKLSTVRHPVDWLRSYWSSDRSKHARIECMKEVREIADSSRSFDGFVREYLNSGWSVEKMFRDYGADVVIRAEDLPWALIEFLESAGVPRRMRERCLSIGRTNESASAPVWNPSLKERVFEAEWFAIEMHDYDLT